MVRTQIDSVISGEARDQLFRMSKSLDKPQESLLHEAIEFLYLHYQSQGKL